MNIIELCLSNGLGGLELYVYRSSDALLHSQKNINKVFAVLTENSKLDHYYKDNASVKTFYIKRFFSAAPLLNAIKLARIIDNNKIDIIHMNWGKDLPLAAFAKVFSKRKPALIYTRQMMITRNKSDFYHVFQYRQIDLMLTITKELESLCRKFIPEARNKTTTLYHGVKSPEKFLDKSEIWQKREETGFEKDDFIIGLIGRLERGKGQHLLIEAIHQAEKNGHNIKALIVGHEMNTGYKDKLRKLAKKLGVLDKIVFQDFTNQPQILMQICDCITLTTNRETFGLVLPEAMRSGVAVIGSNNGGVPEIIEHEKTGLLFESENSDSLYQQINRLYLEPEFKKTLAINGKQKADKAFNYHQHFLLLEQHLQAVVNISK